MPTNANDLSRELHNQPSRAYNNPESSKEHQQSNYQSSTQKDESSQARKHNEHEHAEKDAELGNTTAEQLKR